MTNNIESTEDRNDERDEAGWLGERANGWAYIFAAALVLIGILAGWIVGRGL